MVLLLPHYNRRHTMCRPYKTTNRWDGETQEGHQGRLRRSEQLIISSTPTHPRGPFHENDTSVPLASRSYPPTSTSPKMGKPPSVMLVRTVVIPTVNDTEVPARLPLPVEPIVSPPEHLKCSMIVWGKYAMPLKRTRAYEVFQAERSKLGQQRMLLAISTQNVTHLVPY